MNSITLRRLASDQSSLRRSTPPNYLFPEGDECDNLPDDLTQLIVLITGPQGTPYSQGLWRLQLSMPEDYPKSPPKATFKTKIFHPNVEETTGAVCLNTLKKDWQSKLTLRDILITISCLLIHPNPDSALNATAGSLIQQDYEAFTKQAKLMTSIHAPIPPNLKLAVMEAKHRGEEDTSRWKIETEERLGTSRASPSTSSVVMKKSKPGGLQFTSLQKVEGEPSDDEQGDEAKENDPSQSPYPVSIPSPRRNVLGKRPLSELPTPTGSEAESLFDAGENGMTASQRNILAGRASSSDLESVQPVRKSPKLELSRAIAEPRQHDVGNIILEMSDRVPEAASSIIIMDEEKENGVRNESGKALSRPSVTKRPATDLTLPRPSLRKVSNVGSGRGKVQGRTGIRRL